MLEHPRNHHGRHIGCSFVQFGFNSSSFTTYAVSISPSTLLTAALRCSFVGDECTLSNKCFSISTLMPVMFVLFMRSAICTRRNRPFQLQYSRSAENRHIAAKQSSNAY
eukprot:GEMP01083942.1.p1 GENE.GEMP01083942.1~~GEMP01083942.1.p1  ORF type:complete len:109 (-),score=8.50 GEMP01083942.1:185-511(-)